MGENSNRKHKSHLVIFCRLVDKSDKFYYLYQFSMIYFIFCFVLQF